MERWEQDYYDALIIYDGRLTSEEEDIMKSIQGAIYHNVALNLSIQKIDIASEKRTVKQLLGKDIPEQLPALLLWYPRQMGHAPPFWTGRLSRAVTQQVIQSPKQKEIGNHLLRGAPVVWVMIKSGDSKKDDEAVRILEHELQTARADILDDPVFQPHLGHITDKSDLFPMTVISKSDIPGEQFLQSMILHFYSGLEEIGEPVVIPVFGRGRALGVLAGDEIESQNIQDVIAFLLNPCSCLIKIANPGFDLLMRADWNTLLASLNQTPIRPLMAGVMPDTTMDPDDGYIIDLGREESGFFRSRILSTTAIIIGAVFLCMVLASIIIVKRR
jgi:hypothetical protein